MLVGVRTAPFLGQGLLNVQLCSASAGWDFLQGSPSILNSLVAMPFCPRRLVELLAMVELLVMPGAGGSAKVCERHLRQLSGE